MTMVSPKLGKIGTKELTRLILGYFKQNKTQPIFDEHGIVLGQFRAFKL